MTDLVRSLGELAREHDAWVRLHYVYPYPHVDEVIPLMNGGHVLPYLDVPLQHAHPDVLKRMRRPASGEKNIERIRAWRAACPDITIRSTFIAGFPGETEEEFQYLLHFLQEAQIDRLGCFAYSPVEGAAANEIATPVSDDIREERRARVMQLQATISRQRLQAKVGKTMRVLIDQLDRAGAVARSPADAPEIDGVVYVKRPYDPSRKLKVGEFIDVTITAADAHDLWASAD
jgi:ribosomal protein S12 methylthiotransferase